MNEAELVSAVETLTEAVDGLSKRFDSQQTLIDRIEEQRKEIREQQRGLSQARIALAAIAVLIVAAAFLFVRQEYTLRELRGIQDRTSTEILCPLYEFLALSLKANPPNPVASPEQIELRRTAADAIAAGLDKLGCR